MSDGDLTDDADRLCGAAYMYTQTIHLKYVLLEINISLHHLERLNCVTGHIRSVTLFSSPSQ